MTCQDKKRALRIGLCGLMFVALSFAYVVGWSIGYQDRPDSLYVDYGTVVTP